MRSKSLSGVLLGVIIGVIGAAVQVSAQTQTNTVIFDFDHVWKYNQESTDLGVAWRAPAYNDTVAGWVPDSGGVFGFPGDEVLPFGAGFLNTLLNQTNNGTFTRTYYFRTTFVFTNAPLSNVVLLASNVLDDGAVFYLNGTEVGRLNMPTGTVAYATDSNNGQDVSAKGFELMYIGPQNLLLGTNVLAVELHQNGVGSSDAIFGTALSWFRGGRPVITNQPQSAIVPCAGKPVAISVGASGIPNPTYYWYTNNVYLASQAGNLFNLATTTTNMNGARVHVVVSNALGTVQSSNAFLTVFPDQCGPRALLAESLDVNRFTNQVDITFDEFVQASSRTTNNFRMVLANSNSPVVPITITNVGASGPIARLFANTNLYRTNNYIITINNVRDNLNNVIAPNTQLPVGFKTTNVMFTVGAPGWFFNESEVNDSIGNSWTNINYVDDPFINFNWAIQIAPFIFDPVPGGAIRCSTDSGASLSENRTYFFRKKFTISTNLTLSPRVELTLQYNADDGAVFYLNGFELTRANMPGGDINYFTSPLAAVEHNCTTFTRDVDSDLLRRGNNTNIFAVELHQWPSDTANDPDRVFDAGLAVSDFRATQLRRPPPPRLSIVRQGANLVFSWPTNGLGTNNGYVLQFADVITTNLWREVQTNMANPMTNSMANARRFYRLCWED